MRPEVVIPSPAKAPAGVFNDDFLVDDFLSDLDRAFETIQMAPKKTAKQRAKSTGNELASMQATYIAISQVHLRPVLRYLKAIQMGVASKDLCEIVHYVIGPMIGKTRKVGLTDHARALIEFQRDLKAVVRDASKVLTPEHAANLAASFGPVQMLFDLDFRGHSTAVVNLLGFYKALKRNSKVSDEDMKKLFGIGIPSLTMLRKSSIGELVSLSGIPPEKMSTLRTEARRFSILSLL